eukprot:COSAG02_NODE_6407_length_3594_cov_1.077825_2_plen_339_part_00
MAMQLKHAANSVKGRPVNDSVGMDRDPVWLNINFPKMRPESESWREQLVRECDASRAKQRLSLEMNEVGKVKKGLRRVSTDPDVVRALRKIRRRVSDIDSSRSSSALGTRESTQDIPSRAASVQSAAEQQEVRADAPLESWRDYATERGMTQRVRARVDEILKRPPNESKVDNKLFLGRRETGESDYRGNMKHGADYMKDGHTEYLKLANLVPDTGRIRYMAGAEERRQSRLSVGLGKQPVVGLYRNTEEPIPEPPVLSPLHPTDAAVSNNDASYVLHPSMKGMPNAEQLYLTHADVHTGVNRMLPRRPVRENRYTRYAHRGQEQMKTSHLFGSGIGQ